MKSGPILIVDKLGLIGEPLYTKLSREFSVVFVSKWKKFPVVSDNKYSHIIIIAENEKLEFLPKIIEKAKGVNSDLIFAKPLLAKNIYAEKILREYPIGKIVLYGDIFENNKFIHQARKFGKIQIPGDGLRHTYPIFLNDIVDGLIDIIFDINDKHSLFYLFPKHTITELSLAHAIQKANPEIGIDFIRSDHRVEIAHFPQNGKYLLEDKYPLYKKIRSIDINENSQARGKIEEKENSKIKHKTKKSFSLKILWILIFLIISPLFFTVFFSFLGQNVLYYAKTMMDKGNFNTVQSSFHLSNAFFNLSKKTSNILFFEGKIIGRENDLKNLLEDIDLGEKISQGGLQLFNAGKYFVLVANGKSKNSIEDFTKGQNDLKNAIVIFEKLQGEGKISALFNEKLQSIDPLIKLISNTIDIFPSIFGFEGEKTYLVLIKNNIDSYGILKLYKGKVLDFSIHDVDDADSQLRGHIEPPYAIRRHIPSVHWYMRDSNFDVDFVKSASASSNFLFVETGQKVSGVVGVDISLYKALQAKIIGKNISYFSVAQAISDSLIQKKLLFTLNDKAQNIFTVNGWSGTLWDERKESKNSINDFLGINEANMGLNKINYFLKRKVSQNVKIESDGSLVGEVDINYKNNSASDFLGNYKNYLRVILPLNALISSISIQDVNQAIINAITDPLIYEDKNFKPPQGLEVEKVIQDDKTIYGFLVNVPAGELVRVKIQYTVPRKNTFDLNNFSYSLKLFKQPGIDDFPYSLSLYYPDNINIVKTSDNFKKGDGELSYSGSIVGDIDLIINFTKQ